VNPLDDNGAASIEERTANGETIEPDDELFPLGSLEGDSVTPQTYVRKGLPITVTASLMSAEVPNRGGLLKPDRYGRLLITYLPGKKDDVPLREDRTDAAKVTGYKLRQHLRVTYVQDANDPAALIAQEFEGLLATEPEAAGALLERLTAKTTEALGAPA
jgi:hypothetical protein